MTKWLLHDGICAGVFSEGFRSAATQNQAWEGWLTNASGSCRVLSLLLMRMEKDWNALAAKFRKPWGHKDIDSKLNRHDCSGGFQKRAHDTMFILNLLANIKFRDQQRNRFTDCVACTWHVWRECSRWCLHPFGKV